MNAISLDFGISVRKRPGPVPETTSPDRPLDTAWMVLEAANDLGDHATVDICRRVIDADLNGTPARQSDIHIVLDYFR
jgi:hypothetical protein